MDFEFAVKSSIINGWEVERLFDIDNLVLVYNKIKFFVFGERRIKVFVIL